MIDKSLYSPDSLPQYQKLLQAKTPKRFKRIIIICLILNTMVVGATVVLLQVLTSTYTSRGAAIIPSVGSYGSIQLSETPQTTDAPNQTPYSYLLKIDPRENYYYIAQTEAVLTEAATAVDMTLDEFGEPNIALNNKTSIIEFEISGNSAEEAQEKAWAFYQAWNRRIDDLREAQAVLQNESLDRDLNGVDSQLRTTQEKIAEFRSQSPLKVGTQIEELAERIEDLRIERANILEQQKGADARFRQLSSQLNLTARQAGDALILLDDKVFQSSLQNYSDAIANLQIISSQWSADSPQVRIEEDKKQIAERAMLERSRSLLGRPIDLQFLARLNLGEGGRRELVQELVRLSIEREGLATQSQTKEQQVEQFESRLETLAQDKFTLNRLERDAQISESIFIGGVAQLDVSKPEYATNYPPLQLIKEPSLPSEEDSSQTQKVLLGALAVSFLLTTGLLMKWWESRNKGGAKGRSVETNIEITGE